MLHGEIKVNNSVIGYWQAVREETVRDMPLTYKYRCSVEHIGLDGAGRSVDEFYITHPYDDGALLLTAKILARGNYLMPKD